MKKSNQLLLGGFLAVVLLISAIHITLYAKYQSGNYTVYHAEDDQAAGTMQAFPNILFVSVRDVPVATVRYSDVAQVDKREEGNLHYVQKGDTLLITGKNDAEQSGMHYPVVFHLPHSAALSASNSTLVFEAGKKTAENNPVLYLQKSKAYFSDRVSPLQFGRMKIVASDNSVVSFEGNTQVNALDIQLATSTFAYGEGRLDQLSIVTDSLSHLSIPAKHLMKATLKTTGTE